MTPPAPAFHHLYILYIGSSRDAQGLRININKFWDTLHQLNLSILSTPSFKGTPTLPPRLIRCNTQRHHDHSEHPPPEPKYLLLYPSHTLRPR